MSAVTTESSEVAILSRILRPDAPTFSPEGAKDILALDFDQTDKDRLRELSAKARAGTLTLEEDAEAGRFELDVRFVTRPSVMVNLDCSGILWDIRNPVVVITPRSQEHGCSPCRCLTRRWFA